jgi:hypothetical protein
MSAKTSAGIYQQVFEDVLKAMGRGDVAVEDVSVAGEAVLSAAFVRGLRTRRVALPLERLLDRRQVRAAIEGALADFTPRGGNGASPSAAVPETRFQESGRQHRGGAKFD